MFEIEHGPDGEKKPWWNDGDKVGGAVATIVMLALAILILGGAVKLVTMMFS